MEKLKKYNQAFIDAFNITEDALTDAFVYQCIPEWDSIGHMELMANLEDTFDIMLETDDIIEFSGYMAGKAILAKYDVVV